MNLKERWNAESSAIGAIVHKYVAKVVAVSALVPEFLVYVGSLPREVVPSWTWQAGIVAAFIAHVGGKLTVKKGE